MLILYFQAGLFSDSVGRLEGGIPGIGQKGALQMIGQCRIFMTLATNEPKS